MSPLLSIRCLAFAATAWVTCVLTPLIASRDQTVSIEAKEAAAEHVIASQTISPAERVEQLHRLFPDLVDSSAVAANNTLATVIDDASDDRLDQHSLLDAGLILSGCDSLAIRGEHIRRLESLLPALEERIERAGAALARASAIHEFLHAELLTGEYRETSSELSALFEHGDYNCVSATVLYHHLCQRLDVPCEIVQWKNHVACRVVGDGESIPVEITCRDWFRAARKPTSFVRRADQGRALTEVQLLSLIAYNRGVEDLHGRAFRDSLQASYLALQLDPEHDAAWNNALAAINNLALAHSQVGEYQTALKILARGRRLAPRYATFEINRRHVEYRAKTASFAGP